MTRLLVDLEDLCWSIHIAVPSKTHTHMRKEVIQHIMNLNAVCAWYYVASNSHYWWCGGSPQLPHEHRAIHMVHQQLSTTSSSSLLALFWSVTVSAGVWSVSVLSVDRNNASHWWMWIATIGVRCGVRHQRSSTICKYLPIKFTPLPLYTARGIWYKSDHHRSRINVLRKRFFFLFVN